ncbi:Sodium/hydrogen exchanger [Ascodesmis nigricans]|uniref:Sodium/hydrogen exchanger n=1 Tax=Ascodesmis nigricans TaxID=341454 RepID=A0A4S2MS83_9PEZI|nr:Sodium/hydrogen exchanger [Ascodesmis nigricans]
MITDELRELFAPTDFNIVCTILGGFLIVFGLISYFAKEHLFLSETSIAFAAGIALGPYGANLIRPLDYASGSESRLDDVTLSFCRLVLGVQLVLAGVQLPKQYLGKSWRSLAVLLGPVMVVEWVVTAGLIWTVLPGVDSVFALAIAACVAPTDPILVNHIVKGKFADTHIPVTLQNIIIAESGANDGLGYPFLFIALFTLRHRFTDYGGDVLRHWMSETVVYVVLMSVLYGAIVGLVARKLLQGAKKRGLVDQESFLVYAIAMALFIIGTCGMVGSDDVLACFIAGNIFTLDDWFRLATLDDSLQPTIDRLLNLTIFLYFGSICPFHIITTLHILLAILIILLRRPPIVLALYRTIPDIADIREALIAGYFGPIGVSAIFYLLLACEFLIKISTRPEVDEAYITPMVAQVRATVWACVLGSVVVHGFTIPVIMWGNRLPGMRHVGNLVVLPKWVSRVIGGRERETVFEQAERLFREGEERGYEGEVWGRLARAYGTV